MTSKKYIKGWALIGAIIVRAGPVRAGQHPRCNIRFFKPDEVRRSVSNRFGRRTASPLWYLLIDKNQKKKTKAAEAHFAAVVRSQRCSTECVNSRQI